MTKTTKTIRVDSTLWKRLKIYAINNETTISEILEKLIKQELNRKEQK